MGGRLVDGLKPLQTLFQIGAVGGMSDGELLHLFTTRSNEAAAEAAFGSLVDRHGPLVLRVCRDVLGDAHAAEDAFQATFLVLARRATSIRNADSIAGWLCSIARRVAAKSRADAACRRARERRGAEMAARRTDVRDQAETWPELYEELDRLPEKYRAPLVLCYLTGLTYEQAAGQLKCPVRTVQIRLIRGRERLRGRLIRRGLGPVAGALAVASTTGLARASVPASLTEITTRAALRFAADGAAGVASPSAVSLAEGVLKTMLFTKLTSATAVVLLVFGLAGLGARLAAHGSAAGRPGDVGPKAAAGRVNQEGTGTGPAARKLVNPNIAWGQAVDELQAGIGFRDGEPRSYRTGQAANFVIYLRNTGDKNVSVSHIETVFEEFLPVVEDAQGKTYEVQNRPINLGEVSLVTRTLGEGASIRLGAAWFMIVAPGTKGVATAPTLIAPPGQYRVSLKGFPLRRAGRDADEQKWATGPVAIQIDGPGDVPKPPAAPPPEANRVVDNVNSLDAGNLLWLARDANRRGKYDEASRHARAVTRQLGVGPDVLCPAWMNVFYAAHRTGDREAAAAALRSFDESAAQLPVDDPVVIEMGELKQALGLGGAVAPRAVAAPPEGDGFWQSGDPTALGLDSGAIREHLELAKSSGADAVLVAFRGKVVSEWYSPRYRTPAATMSSAKSITGLLAGLLVADGKLAVDDPVSRFLPGWAEGRRERVTVGHLLTMSSGLSRAPVPNQSVGFVADKNGYVVGLEPASEPGSRWEYSNEGAQLLSPILEKAAGVPLQDYARDRLFRPLGMDETRLRLDTKGHAWTYADAETSLRDFARLGELMRNKGRWQGRQIVPESWVDASTRSCRLKADYGYLWWLIDDPKGFAARGYLDTHCYVFPGLELVVARIQARPYLFAMEPYEPKALALFKRIVRK